MDLGFDLNYSESRISLVYNSSIAGTENVTLSIYNYSNDELLFQGSETDSDTVTINYIVPNQNGTYLVEAYVSHPEGSEHVIKKVVELRDWSSRLIDLEFASGLLGLSIDQIYMVISMILIISVALIFGAVHSGIGSLTVTGLALFFVFIGWLTVSWVIMALMVIVSLFGKMTQGRRIE